MLFEHGLRLVENVDQTNENRFSPIKQENQPEKVDLKRTQPKLYDHALFLREL